jgi:hypothetical protein
MAESAWIAVRTDSRVRGCEGAARRNLRIPTERVAWPSAAPRCLVAYVAGGAWAVGPDLGVQA